jgi:hypothetical protein
MCQRYDNIKKYLFILSKLHIDNMKGIDCQTSYEAGGIIYEKNISN